MKNVDSITCVQLLKNHTKGKYLMTKTMVLFCFLALIGANAKADIVCEISKTGFGFSPAKVIIANGEVTVSGGLLTKPRVFKNISTVNGLITDPSGIAITMQNHYGCWKNVVIITEFREPFEAGYMEAVNVGTCSGGSTSDDLCF